MDKLSLLRRLLDVSEKIITDNFEECIIKPIRDSESYEHSEYLKCLFPYVMDIIVRRAFRLSKGVWHLCNQGYGDAGIGAVRTLFELCIDVEYIKQDKENRVERFYDHHWYAGAKFSMDLYTQMRKSVPREKQNKIIGEYNRVKSKYQDFNDLWWSGKKPDQMAKEVGMPMSNFKLVYGTLSTYVHSYSHTLDYEGEVKDDCIRIIPTQLTPSAKLLDFVAMITTIYFKYLMEGWLDASGASTTPELQRLFEEIKSTYKEWRM
ncbi:hypothetical protein FJZ31_04735 [Candidatus Poribacteria bacterium]|nr:hypothetical protein [Candidatus Poribacteria bacterium]